MRAHLNKDPDEVAAMFDGVAKRYDLLNDILSVGRTKAWRKEVTSIIGPKPGMKILDIAAGTGSSTLPLVQAGASAIALDFSQGMLDAGKRRHPSIEFKLGDALNLPFPSDSFDVTTISFGLRNTHDTAAALREAFRVTKPGGRMVICEFSHPTNPIFRFIYMKYLMRSLPSISKLVTTNPDAYIYLAESIQAWPSQSPLADLMSSAGWERVTWQNLTFGIVAVHIGHKPSASESHSVAQ